MGEFKQTIEHDLPFFLSKNESLGPIRIEDDLLHPKSFANVPDPSATETQYFGFSVPEANIHAVTYMWWHPNLRICSGGLFVFRGIKATTVHAELCDWRLFMSDAALKNDLHEFRFDNGYGVKVLEPNKRFHITYQNAAQNSSVDIVAEALLPGVMFGDGNHFDQTMRMKGELVLRGETFEVNCYSVRDRSWGKPRPELLLELPPSSWMVGTFTDEFSFNLSAYDQAIHNPALKGKLVQPHERSLSCGWVHKDGKLGRIIKVDKRVTRGSEKTISYSVDLQFSDDLGREFDVRGTLIASCPIQNWTNVWMVVNLMRWECDGLIGHGDNQEAFWGDYLNSI